MNDYTQNNRADKVIANQSGPQYANEGDVHENTGSGPQNNTSGHAYTNSGGTGNVFVSGRAGDIATDGSKIDKRKIQFSPFVLLGHLAGRAAAHPVAAGITVLIVGAGAGAFIVPHVLPHAKAAHKTAPSLAASTVPAPTHTPGPIALPPGTDGSWPQLGGGPARTGYQPGETRIGTADVTKLALNRTYQSIAPGGGVSAPLIANGIIYVDSGGRLDAFDATGKTGCADVPTTCTPLWTAVTVGYYGMTVADGDVFVTNPDGVLAFDAAGATNCSGTPKVCNPVWTTSIHLSTGFGFAAGLGSPVVANGVLYVPGGGIGKVPSQGGAYVAAFDPAGSAGCSGTPVVCVPMWTTTGPPLGQGNYGSPVVANGVIYIANESTLYAFDATESAACSGTPKTCAPLWTAALPGAGATAVAVSGGTVYVGTTDGLDAFNAAGTTNCSTRTTAKTCAPLWTAPVDTDALAVANGIVYAATNGTLYALDATAPGNCPGTDATGTCTLAPLWTSADSTDVDAGSVTVANGVVYVTSADGGIDAYDAAGSLNCSVSGTAKTCTPLWQDLPGHTDGGSPAIVNGVLFVTAPGNGDVYAFSS